MSQIAMEVQLEESSLKERVKAAFDECVALPGFEKVDIDDLVSQFPRKIDEEGNEIEDATVNKEAALELSKGTKKRYKRMFYLVSGKKITDTDEQSIYDEKAPISTSIVKETIQKYPDPRILKSILFETLNKSTFHNNPEISANKKREYLEDLEKMLHIIYGDRYIAALEIDELIKKGITPKVTSAVSTIAADETAPGIEVLTFSHIPVVKKDSVGVVYIESYDTSPTPATEFKKVIQDTILRTQSAQFKAVSVPFMDNGNEANMVFGVLSTIQEKDYKDANIKMSLAYDLLKDKLSSNPTEKDLLAMKEVIDLVFKKLTPVENVTVNMSEFNACLERAKKDYQLQQEQKTR